MTQLRTISFAELETWLRELPWWELDLQYAGGTPGSSYARVRAGRRGRVRSQVEAEAIDRAALTARVQLLRRVIVQLSPDLQEFLHIRFMAKTATMGHTVRQTCQILNLRRAQYYRKRERALLPILAELYYNRVDLGQPYSFCDPSPEPIPVHLRST